MLDFSLAWGRKLPLILQAEAAECGLACLGMVAGFHGYRTDLTDLRKRFPISLKGITLATLVRMANQLQLATRPLTLDIQHLKQLKLPCILHWNFNHFVVLKSVRNRSILIHDPGVGIREVVMEEVSRSFTGVALELWPNPGFKPAELKQTVRLRSLLGPVKGLYKTFAQIISLALALELFSIASPFYLQWIIDNVLVSADHDLLITLALGFGLLMVFQHAVSAVRGWVIMYMGATLGVQWRANVFTHLLSLPVEYFQKRHLGDVVSRFGSIDIIQRTLTTSFLEAILNGLMASVEIAIMFVYSPLLSFIVLGAMSLYVAVRWLTYGPLQQATEEQIIHAATQQTHFLETVRGVKTIKLFQRQEERRSIWLNLLVEQINADLRSQKIKLWMQFLNGLLFGLENILIVYLGARLVIDGHFSVGALMAFNAYRSQFDTRVAALIDKFVEIKMLQLQGERLAEIVFQKPELTQGRLTINAEATLPSIEVKQLRFRYTEQEPYILDEVSFKIDSGESVAIVGPSGCGKSTLINLLLGVLSPTEGDILIGGISVKQLGLDAVREMVGTVLQDDVLFAGSIAENISFFDPNPDFARIHECARLTAVYEDIVSMPMGFNTLVGDMGTVLSGGQKQRILLARALYKRPKILFLDEATSHLDVQREKQVNAAVQSLNMTRVIVAHRPETIGTADRVIVLCHGSLIDETRVASAERVLLGE